MTVAGEQISAGRGVPDVHGPVLPHRREEPAVGAERNHAYRVPFESEDFLPGRRVPNLHFPTGRLSLEARAAGRGNEAPAIGSEYHATHRVGVGFPCEGFLVGL